MKIEKLEKLKKEFDTEIGQMNEKLGKMKVKVSMDQDEMEA